MDLLGAKIEVYSNKSDKSEWFILNNFTDVHSLYKTLNVRMKNWEIVDYENIYDFLIDDKSVDPIYWYMIDSFNMEQLGQINDLVDQKLPENSTELKNICDEFFKLKNTTIDSSNPNITIIENDIHPIEVTKLDKSQFNSFDEYINIPTLYFNKNTHELIDSDYVIGSVVERIMNTVSMNNTYRIELFDYLGLSNTDESLNYLRDKLIEFIDNSELTSRVKTVYYLMSTFTKQYTYELFENQSFVGIAVETTRWLNSIRSSAGEFNEFYEYQKAMFTAYDNDTIRIIKCPSLGYSTDYIFREEDYQETITYLHKRVSEIIKKYRR